MADTDSWRRRITLWVESPPVERIIILLILVNAVTLGLETSRDIMASWGTVITVLDRLILSVFVVEILLRITGRGWRFFRDAWSVFDFFVVSVSLLPAGADYAVLRALRVLRVLRLLSMVPQMRRVVSALLAAIPGLSSIIMVLVLIFYVFAVMATKLFGSAHPEWFGDIGRSMYTLFQIMTLESWSMGIVRPVMEHFPYAWLFFVPFIMIATFTMLNLFIAIIVNAMQIQSEREGEKTVQAVENATYTLDNHMQSEVKLIHGELKALRQLFQEHISKTDNKG